MRNTSKIRKLFILVLIMAFLNLSLSVSAFCQVGGAVSSPEISSSIVTDPVDETVEEIIPSKSGNVTINFKDVDIQTVLHYLSEVSGVDIVPTYDVVGNVTVRLRDKPWEVALDVITRNSDYAYTREDTIIRVMPKAKLNTEEPVTAVIPLNYIIQDTEESNQNVAKLLEAITSVLKVDAGESVTYLPSANSIVVAAVPARLNAIKDMVKRIDVKIPQVMLEAKIIEVRLDKNDQFGIDWNAVVSISGSKRPTTLPFERTGAFGFLPGEQRKYLPYSTNIAGTTISEESDFPYVDFTAAVDPTAVATTGSVFSYGTLDFSAFSAVLRFIDEWDDTNILSSPRITTLNNQPAVIKVITNVFLQKQQTATDTASVVTVEFEDEPREVGVILEVTPHVNDNGEITVNLKPQVSTNLTFSELEVSGATNTVAMTYNSREAETQVMVRDGETVFIGGLITETNTKEDHKFPILGDMTKGLPFLGPLFNYEQDNVDKTEVVFFITVHLLKDGPHSVDVSNTEDEYAKYFEEEINEAEIEADKAAVRSEERNKTKTKVIVSKDQAKEGYKAFLDFRKKQGVKKTKDRR
ncbi:MAG: secretin N-terminal domain-containing protein [Candidatus Omnitrophota bacterium]